MIARKEGWGSKELRAEARLAMLGRKLRCLILAPSQMDAKIKNSGDATEKKAAILSPVIKGIKIVKATSAGKGLQAAMENAPRESINVGQKLGCDCHIAAISIRIQNPTNASERRFSHMRRRNLAVWIIPLRKVSQDETEAWAGASLVSRCRELELGQRRRAVTLVLFFSADKLQVD